MQDIEQGLGVAAALLDDHDVGVLAQDPTRRAQGVLVALEDIELNELQGGDAWRGGDPVTP